MLALLAMLPLAGTPADVPRFDGAEVHRIQSIGGAGGSGGNASVIINGGIIYLNPQAGSGGNGGSAMARVAPSSAPPLEGRTNFPPNPPSTPIARCTLKIAGKTIVDTGCGFAASAAQIQFRGPSDTTNYLMTVDKRSHEGFLSSAKTPTPRSLGTMLARGPCWVSTDASVEICGWK